LNESASNEDELADLDRGFDAFYEWSLPRVYRYALAATGQRAVAEDITSEAFLSIVNEPSITASPRLVLLARLRRTVHNKAVDWIRHQTVKRKSLASVATEENDGHGDSDSLVDAEQREMVFKALDQLPEDYRRALQWRYFDDQSVQQIANLGGWSKSATNSLLYRARAAFRSLVHECNHDAEPSLDPNVTANGDAS
jgi:RNA polymerase sigma-70 factor (ECF subfamily)